MQARRDVAIVGYACRLPGAGSADAFWRLLEDNRCSVSRITEDRFATWNLYHPSAEQRGRSYTFAAGVIDDVWGFDATAFGMSPREAEQVDPQQRHILEVAFDALAHAGIRPSTLASTETGVYIGASSVDHATRFVSDPNVADVHMMTGNSASILSNRISYALDLHGPSLTIDTACSSSLVALHLAAEAIRAGSIDTAIVGGVNLLLSPFSYVGFSRASMLSPTGLCRPFDAAADGYVRSEGAIVVVLRSMAAARRSGSRIHGVIVASGINQDGRTTGLSLPSPLSQRRLLEQVYGDYGVDPSDLLYVEAHGTGTKVGDPIEADALGKGLAQLRAKPLPIGSVKSNIGHLEPVSGLAGLLKALGAMANNLIPATLHQREPSPYIPFQELNLRVVDRNWRLPESGGPTLVGVNSFGFGGTNSHVVLRRDGNSSTVVHLPRASAPPPLILTAHSKDALPAVATAFSAQFPRTQGAAHEYIRASAHQRDFLPHRVLIRGESHGDIRNQLSALAAGTPPEGILSGQALGHDLPVAFLFSGNGSQWAGMGRAAWHSSPAFREALQDIDGKFASALRWSVVERLFAQDLADQLDKATYSQPLLLALQIATVRALEDGGVVPAATLGHSVGEIAAAWAAGALSLTQAIDVVVARSRNQECCHGSGTMAAVMLSEREARRLLNSVDAKHLSIAAVNSWRSVTISGPRDEIDAVLACASEQRISARRIDVAYPFHSSLVEPVRTPLLRELDGLQPLPLRRLMISSVTGAPAETSKLGPEHWWHNVRDPVQFETALGALIETGLSVFLEIGPKPILGAYVRDALHEGGKRGVFVESLSEADSEAGRSPIERTISKVLLAGGAVDLRRFFGPPPAMVQPLPPYPWQHTPFSVALTREADTVLVPATHPLLGRRLRLDCHEWFSIVDPSLFPWLQDHKVSGLAVFPAAAFIDVMLGAGQQHFGSGALELRDLDIVQPIVFDGKSCYDTLVRLTPETGIVEFLSRLRGNASDWALNARGLLSRSPTPAGPPMQPPPQGAVIVLKDKVYEWASRLDFDYGPAFQRLRQVAFSKGKIAFGSFEPNSDAIPDWTVTDLTAIDGSFHALLASEEAGVADMPMKQMLPFRFGSIKYYKPGVPAAYVWARTIRQSPRTFVADFALFDANGECIAKLEGARLAEAPAHNLASPLSLVYELTRWRLDHPGEASSLQVPATSRMPDAADAARLDEGLLLLEAGCLRAAWQALGSTASAPPIPANDENGPAPWHAHYRAALLWHLESRGLANPGTDDAAPECHLPQIDSIVRSLTVRHPTMTAETALLALFNEMLPQILAVEGDSAEELDRLRRRARAFLSQQALGLQHLVVENVRAAIAGCSPARLLRVLMVGTGHLDAGRELVRAFKQVELVVTDVDATRVEQAQRMLEGEFPRVRCISWDALEQLPRASFDLAFAIDSLSELCASRSGLVSVTRVLRRGAPVVAGEMAPSTYWDVVRGIDPGWWARSTNAEFPVGALLTREEWQDEFQTAGLQMVTSTSIAEGHAGVLISGIVGEALAADPSASDHAGFAWDGDPPTDGALHHSLRTALQERSVILPAGAGDADDCIWAIDAATPAQSEPDRVGRHLVRIGELCRRLADKPRRLWIVLDFGAEPGVDPLSHPVWCAVAAAMRVAQNEYGGLTIRTLGLSGKRAGVNGVADLLEPDDESEIFICDDQRFVFRIRHGLPDTDPSDDDVADIGTVLVNRRGLDGVSLDWAAAPRRAPDPGFIEIEVAATGLNFRDVMWNMRLLPEEALENGYAGPGLGMECAGIVSRVGAGVDAFRPGDRVVAFAPNAFCSHAVVPAVTASALPPEMSFEAASTLPVAFLTAYYSLAHLARLQKDEVVLIHGAAGGVGLAAIQIARHIGAKIVATAGTAEKRAFLRNYGADLVCDSRSLRFADELRDYAGGKGADVVLNSVSGEAMIRTLDCLSPFGRFVELGKRDFFANTHIPLRPMRQNLTYFGVDVDQLMAAHADLARRLFGEVIDLFRQGELVALPHRVFEGTHVQDAFRLMQRSGHIGKVIVRPVTRAAIAIPESGLVVDRAATHVVIGGTRGFGLATAEWLADRGASRLILASRSGPSTEAELATISQLRDRGVNVTLDVLDVADQTAVHKALDQWRRTAPIKGIVHAAMVLDDRLIERIDDEAMDRVLRPKATGALNLESAVDGLDLDYLILYSSATTYFGNPGQYNYVAANAYVEGIARRMRARGIPAQAVAWGAIEDAGYLARNMASDAALKRRFTGNLITAKAAFGGLNAACDAGKASGGSYAVARIDWAMAKRELSAVRRPLFSSVARDGSARHSAEAAALLERLKGRPVEEVAEALTDIVVEEIARVLRLPLKEVDRHRPLADIGMDSLMMLELRMTVESSLQIEVPMLSLSSGITPAEVARRVAPLVTGHAQQNVPSAIVALSTSHIKTQADATDSALQTAAIAAVTTKLKEMDGAR